MTLPLQDTVIVITGASSGIGLATSIKLAALGANLALCDINLPGLLSTLPLLTPRYHTISICDVRSTDSVSKFISSVLRTHGHITHVFNCAGVNPTAVPTASITDTYFDTLIDTNLKGTFNITRASIPHLGRGSAFVNVSSVAGVRPLSEMAVYCASKYAVIGFSQCLALELGPKGIRTNVVAPGYIHTPTSAGVLAGPEALAEYANGVSLGRIGTAEEVADVVAFLFSDESRYMNGSVVEVNGGIK